MTINLRKIQKSHGKAKNSSKKLKTQGENSRSGRIFPHLASQVVLKKMPGVIANRIIGIVIYFVANTDMSFNKQYYCASNFALVTMPG